MINDLRLKHFRSYSDESFEFDRGVNIIVGPNASGKTNLLEGVLLGCAGGSYRGKDAELIAFGADWARLDARTDSQTRIIKISRGPGEKVVKRFEIDGHKLTRLPLLRTVPVVVFEPAHLQLLHGSPEQRRNFLDDLIEQTIAGYATTRRQYRRALSQRNALLKKGLPAASHQLFAWNIRLSELGGQIAKERLGLLEQFNNKVSAHYSRLANKRQRVKLAYQSGCDPSRYSSQLLRKLEHDIELDTIRGFTSHGPHRDDFEALLNGKPAANSASRGEIRTLLLALKLLEMELVEESRQQPPVLLLDDVFSELDGARRKALTEVLQNHQSFITTTDADVVVQHFTETTHVIPLA